MSPHSPDDPGAPVPIIVTTGQDCPRSGVWRAIEVAAPPLNVVRGEIMPGIAGRVVTWVLATEDDSSPSAT